MTNYIKKFHDQETFKRVYLPTPFDEKYELYVSNYGNVKRITKSNNQSFNLLQSLTEGYPSIGIGVTIPLTEKERIYFNKIRESIQSLKKEITDLNNELLILNGEDENISRKISENEALLKTITKKFDKSYRKRENERRKNYGNLVHRLVALHFIDKPSEEHNLVAHLDFDKLNNHHSNLQWMTRAENKEHQKNSPFVIKSKQELLTNPTRRTNTKLTEKQVMILKKRMNEGVSLRELSKRNKVTETQLLRIKRGINWGKVPAAL